MTHITRRRFLASTAALGAGAAIGTRAGAHGTVQLPDWGQTDGATDLQAGPLGLNPASDPGQVPVAIRIPDAEVDAEVEKQQIVDGQMLDPTGPWVVAWYESSARAGEIGNLLGSGHVDYWEVGPSVFYNVSDLTEGAPIDVVGRGGTTYTYEVEYVRQLELATVTIEELNSPEVVGRTDYAAITLITCGGTFDYDRGEYLFRDIIRGRLVSAQRPDQEPAGAPAESGDGSGGEGEGGALAEGAQATVTTDGVNLRSEPTTSSEVVQVVAAGTVVTITGGPQEADGYTWLPVQLEDGTEGWLVQDFLTPNS